MKFILILFAIVVCLALFVIGWCIGTYNRFVKMKVEVDEGFSTMDVFLKKRSDLIPNLVETVKGYAKHESQTLENVIAARSKATSTTTPAEKMEAEGQLSQALGRLLAIAENYPTLQANENFMNLQNQLNQIEDEIAGARRYYNAVVKKFNTAIKVFPAVIISNILGYKEYPMFLIYTDEERENVQVQF